VSHRGEIFYLSLAPLFFLLLLSVSLFIWMVAATTGALIGFTPLQTAVAFAAIVFGSAVNIPVKKVKGKESIRIRTVTVFGIQYPVPRTERPETILAVNLGGAVIPTLISVYLIAVSGATAALATGLTAVATALLSNRAAKSVKRGRYRRTYLIPGLSSAAAAILCLPMFRLEPSIVPRVAFAGGVFGALTGADLMNLDKIANLGAPIASIGGAGTFDGILVTGVTAVMLGALLLGL